MSSFPPWHNSAWMKAARREPTEFTPVWLMRQAGRYQPEYRALRETISFLGLCKTPTLCAQVMLQTVEQLGVDAAIIFSDLLLILEPMGVQLEFDQRRGPVIQNPVRGPADVDRLVYGDETPLIQAAGKGHLDVVRFLLEHGADPSLTVYEDAGGLPLRGGPRSPLSQARRGGHSQIVELLLANGAR